MPLSRRAFLGTAAALAANAAHATEPNGFRLLATSDQGGRPDGVQAMVSRRHLFVGHMFGNGFTVLDVDDPRAPKPVRFVEAPENTRTHHLQSAGDLLLVACGADIPTIGRYDPSLSYYQQSFAGGMRGGAGFASGLKVYDIDRPAEPREIAFLEIPGIGVNRLWWTGGRHAYLSAHVEGFTDHILVVVDLAEPTAPKIVGRWWLPGMWREGSEVPGWRNQRVALHHMIVAGDLGYAAWRDGGFTVLDLADPTQPRLRSHMRTAPPFPGGTHTALPLPGRGLALVLDESSSLNCVRGLSRTWVYDVRRPDNPVSIATLPMPSASEWCRPGENFGPHNLHENRPGTFRSEEIVFSTWHNAGVRAYDIRDPFAPREVAAYVTRPPARILDPRPGNALAPQTCDVLVQEDGVVYVTDWNAGLTVLEYRG